MADDQSVVKHYMRVVIFIPDHSIAFGEAYKQLLIDHGQLAWMFEGLTSANDTSSFHITPQMPSHSAARGMGSQETSTSTYGPRGYH